MMNIGTVIFHLTEKQPTQNNCFRLFRSEGRKWFDNTYSHILIKPVISNLITTVIRLIARGRVQRRGNATPRL